MAESSWPTVAGSRVVTDDQFELMTVPWSPDGIINAYTDPTTVFGDSTGRQVKVRANRTGIVGGHGYSSGTSDTIKSIGANASGSTRIDAVVMGLDRTTWAVTTYVKAGTAGAGVPPALLTDARGSSAGKWEIPLATVTVANGASTITAADVTNVAWYVSGDRIATSSTNYYQPSASNYSRLWHYDTGNEWVSASGAWKSAGGWRMVQLLSANAASVTFSNIPSTFHRLQLRWRAKSSSTSAPRYLMMQVNGTSTAVYYEHIIYWLGTASALSGQNSGQTRGTLGLIHGNDAATGANFSGGSARIIGWNAHSSEQGVHWEADAGGMHGTSGFRSLTAGTVALTGPYTSLVLFADSGNLMSGSEFMLWGWE